MPGNPFEHPGEWLRGSLHTHTTQSDGAVSPEENLAWHAGHGYDFVGITDHDRVTMAEAPEGLVLLPGAELSLRSDADCGSFHLVSVGLPPDFDPPMPGSTGHQEGIDLVRSVGALCFVAHPHWSEMSTRALEGLSGFLGVEVFNHGCDRENRSGLAETYWDRLLLEGKRVYGFATDDSHWRIPDHGGGWIVARSEERTPEGVLSAIHDGRFYASSGPSIEDIRLDGNRLYVRCSPVRSIYWMEGARGWSAHADEGQFLTEAEFEINPRRYFRVTVADVHGRCAWSNPFFVE